MTPTGRVRGNVMGGAGRNERLAQDMFARSGRGLEGPAGEVPTSGPSAGLSAVPGS
jgi:hypothetical protein